MVFQEHRIQAPSASIFKNYLDMPLWQLRHLEVSRFIARYGIKKILDIACSEALLINRLSRSDNLELLVGLDIDPVPLEKAQQNIKPELIQDEISYHRKQPLHVRLYQANIFEALPPESEQIELVTMIQFIEHVEELVVPNLLQVVFQIINPQYIFITTPNSDFNKWFNFEPGQMRHPDHKFEWNQYRFEKIMKESAEKYDYQVNIFGIGEHICDGSLGFCSQGASFIRKERRVIENSKRRQMMSSPKIECISDIKYPMWDDNVQKAVYQKINDLIMKNNYSQVNKIVHLFANSKIGKKLSQNSHYLKTNYFLSSVTEQQRANLCIGRDLILFVVKNCLKYCQHDPEYDLLYYEYEESDLQEEEEDEELRNYWSEQQQKFELFKKENNEVENIRNSRQRAQIDKTERQIELQPEGSEEEW